MKKIMTYILAVVIFLTLQTPTFANQADMSGTLKTALFDLQNMGIMVGDETGDMQMDQMLTRAELSKITVRLLRLEAAAAAEKTQQFSDVPGDHWAYYDINLLYRLNIISGTGGQLFEPEREITLQEAAKIFVTILGYSYSAEQCGGYPQGYMIMAGQLGLLKSVNTEGAFNREAAALMAYNALDIELMQTSFVADGSQRYSASEQTLRMGFENAQHERYVKYTGIVTATIDAYIDAPVSGMEENEIEINGKIYQLAQPLTEQYLGMWVDFYAYEDDSTGVEYVTDLVPNRFGSVFEVQADLLKEADQRELSYYADRDAQKADSYTLSDNCVYVYNNELREDWTAENLENVENGTVTLIDNTGDEEINVVIVKEYTSVVVDRILEYHSTVILKDGFFIGGRRDIELAGNRNDIVTVRYQDGTDVDISEIKEGDVLSAYVNQRLHRLEMIYSAEVIEGEALEICDDSVVIGTETFYFEKEDILHKVESGKTAKFHLNFNREIVDVIYSSDDVKYAYVLQTEKESLDTYQLQAIIPEKLMEREVVSVDDTGKETVSRHLVCRNNSIAILELKEQIKLDGVKTEAETAVKELLGKTILYKLDADGRVSQISYPARNGGGYKKYYNDTEKTFGKGFGGAFGIDFDTYAICIPEESSNPNPTQDDYLVDVEMNGGQEYSIMAYGKDLDTKMAELIVVTMPMISGKGGVIRTTSDVGLVTDKKLTAGEDGEPVIQLSVLSGKGNIWYAVNSHVQSTGNFDSIEKGDLIAFSLNNYEELDAYQKIQKIEKDMEVFYENPLGEDEVFSGYVTNVNFDDVSETLNRWVHTVSCGLTPDGAAERVYEVEKFNGPPVIVYDEKTQKAVLGDIEQLRTNGERIFVSAADDKVRAIVLIR